ncbi:MAG: GAF domain-containing protein, partial [Ginsengibacter sp.]
MPVTNVSEEILGFASFMRPLYQKGMRSYLYYPMQNNDGLLGLLELASPVPNLFTHEIMSRIEPAIPLLSVAMLKSRDAFDSKIDTLVKEKFTALQPSVEWKFSEVAWDYIKKNGSATETAEIIFENVYPLYGAVDIRNSSIERNCAIQKDLKEHLNLVDETLDKLQSQVQLTLLEELKFKNLNFQQAIENVLFPEDEIRITEFLENEAEPVFTHLQKSSNLQIIVENYFDVQKDCSGPLYYFRDEYEKTLASINKAVADYLEEQEDNLQKSYPHYFEKYRTDGVEYNIYIGQSMAPNHPFDLLYLKNIRLWQLKSMAELAKITHQLLPQLNVPLQTTQLILIHHQPISISFRKDERRFDVEGNYNIRYEIMKKRIDKACIKDTNERLTQPGKIAMVYSNQKEAHEYEEYIQFLQSKNLLKPGIETLDLEEMQGLRGMKALRVSVNLE